MPSIPARLLTGASNVDTWSESVWAPVLKGTRIVVSTPKVLDDALHHGFVRMNTLALLVFDEAHNCVGKAAESKIMMDYYHPRKRSGDDVPSILGLTASPSMRSKTEDMEKLEMILDSRCISPTLHRQELLKCVKKPRIYRVDYTLPSFPTYTTAIQSLRDVYDSLDIRDDPAVLHLVADLTERKRRLLVKMIEQHDTYTQNQIKGLYSRSLGISRQLGTWAADQYLWRAITEHLGRVDAEDEILDKWASEEKRYLGAALRKVGVVAPPADPTDVSDKVRLLIQELLASTQESPVCIVFAQERATVSALYELLTACTDITEKFRIGIVMGSSSYQGRKRNIYDLSRNTDVDLSVLQKFRSGHINLLLATSVLEEGIDVPACNLVICFDELQSFKAFIQRRGRARQRESRLVLFFERSNRITDQWEAMEREMKRQYEDEDRLRQDIEVLEHEEQSQNVFEVESTGAKIGLDEAKQHLEHFCRTLSHGEFVDARPDYILYRDWSASGMAVSATVILPPFLPKEVRQAESRSSWKSESNATKDAAFQAYMALYHAGLVNDNLLPFKPDQLPGIETRAPIADVESSFNPWKDVAQAWNAGGPRWVYTFTYYDERNTAMGEYDITLPVYLDQPRPIRIFRDYEIFWELRSSTGRKISSSEAEEMPDNTSTLLSLHFGHRWPVYEKGHVIRVTSKDAMLSREHIGSQPLESGMEGAKNQQYLVRDHLGTPYLYQDLLTSKPAPELVRNYPPDYEVAPEDVPYVVLKKWTKRADFLHRLLSGPGQTASSKPYGWVLPLPWAKVDTVPLDHAQFGMLLPSIIHELEVMLVTKDLADTLLSPLGISNLGLVRQAISAGSACEPFNYERLELLGDSILKYCAAILAASARECLTDPSCVTAV
jgi:ERCC4-related helicase